MTRHSAACALLAAAAAAAPLTGCGDRHPTDPALARAQTITAAGIRQRIADLADDSMRGRPTPSPELDRAAAYAVAAFQSFGLGPGPATGFLQTWSAPGGPAPNAVARLEGADPQLRNETVVFVAHLDHIGTPASGEGCSASGADSVCNGADDNASGSAAVIELARAFGGLVPRPRRSMLFLLVSGEELGLLGSSYYVAHPAVPLTATVAAINLDMISRNATDSVLVIGTDVSTLGPLTAAVGQEHPELGMRPVGAPWPYGGSDHIPFGTSGVPSLFFFSGLHPDYHRPSDEVARVDPEKTARIVRLVYYVGLAIANQPARPTWNAGPVRSPPAARPEPL